MTIKEFTKHYNNILKFPKLGIYPEKEDCLKSEIQRLADIDKISYPLALDKIYSIFLSQYLEADPDDSNFRDIQKATVNLLFLKELEGLDNDWLHNV